jgi:hypothetical protein
MPDDRWGKARMTGCAIPETRKKLIADGARVQKSGGL